jgi:uncharacterized protein YbbC (DUF1343 family)
MRRLLLTTLSALAILQAPAVLAAPKVKLGVEVLLTERMSVLKGKRVGLVTNMSAIDSQGRSDIDLLARAPGVKLTALFAPEHGLRAELDVENIPDGKDPRTGVPVYSLYNKDRAPSAKQLATVDVLVFDIQDAGSRFYTYSTTLGLCMEAAKRNHKPFVVLDRPNPITGKAEGDLLDPTIRHFTGRYPLTTRHGMTIGELARYINGVENMGCDLTVVPMTGWTRGMWYDQTGLPWRRPSPAMLSPDTALYYAGIGLFEATNVNCRAPGKPFRWIGAPWIGGDRLASELTALSLPGVRFSSEGHTIGGKRHGGVNVLITDREAFQPIDATVSIMATLARLYPGKFEPYRSGLSIMTGGDDLWLALAGQGPLEAVTDRYRKSAASYDAARRPYLLYQ